MKADDNTFDTANRVTEPADCPTWIIEYANGDLKIDSAVGVRKKAKTNPAPYSEAEEAQVRSALACIPADDRDIWRDVGAALHSLNWDGKGFEIWTDWSRSCPENFGDADQKKTWESFDRPYEGARITMATIYFKAREPGWSRPVADFHTDLGNARRLINLHGNNVRFIAEWGKWIVWNQN